MITCKRELEASARCPFLEGLGGKPEKSAEIERTVLREGKDKKNVKTDFGSVPRRTAVSEREESKEWEDHTGFCRLKR